MKSSNAKQIRGVVDCVNSGINEKLYKAPRATILSVTTVVSQGDL